jgi:hypothetical protein
MLPSSLKLSLVLSSRVKRGICILELQIPRFARNDKLERESLKAKASYAHQQGFLQALIKIYSLVDCPIYSVVKYRPRENRFWLLALGFWPRTRTSTISPPPWWIWVKPTAKGQRPKAAFFQPNVRRQATCVEP